MFEILTKKIKRNNTQTNSHTSIDVNYIIEKLHKVVYERTNSYSGHIHLYVRDKSDHIIIIWADGELKKIAAKSSNCGRCQYIHWCESEFADCKRKDVLGKFHNQIEVVKIDMDGFNRTWPSGADFIKWLDNKETELSIKEI